jgi:glycosyltransferase involved in cell wall biosynthesis
MTTFTPTVSIIIPVYNGANTIAACLESLLGQVYPAEAYDIIVVENGSTDNTTQIVEKYPVRLFHSHKRGPAPARNLGIAKSKAEIVAFTDADCIADPQWLSKLVQPYTDPQVGCVGGTILPFTSGENTFVERFIEETLPLVNFVSEENTYLPHLYTGNASYRRRLLNQVGGFNADLVTAEDVDLSWRFQLETGAKLRYVPEAIIYHRYETTLAGLAREYRQWGFGEVLLDTMYGKYPDYPRGRWVQFRRILNQLSVLPRYSLSVMIRQVRRITGRTTPYEAAVPRLWLLIESNNIRGKLEGLIATRFMTDDQAILEMETEVLIDRLYASDN